MIRFFPRKSQIKAWSCWFPTAKGLFMFSRAAGGSLLEVQATEGKKGNITFIQSSHTKCHLPTGLALHGELQIARSAAKQKTNLKTNVKKLLCFWAAGNYTLTQARKESVWLRDFEVDQLQSLLIFPLVPVGFGLLAPLPCCISFRSSREEQSDLKPEAMASEELARDQTQAWYCCFDAITTSVILKGLPHPKANFFPNNHCPPANLDSPRCVCGSVWKLFFIEVTLFLLIL